MMLAFIIVLIGLLIACLHQCNEAHNGTLKRFKFGLIMILTGDIFVGIATLNGLFNDTQMFLMALPIIGITCWLASERRTGVPKPA